MDTTVRRTGYGHVRDLVGRAGQAYRFVEHTVEPDRTLPVRCHLDGHRAFLVIQGK
jgi:hypothetical protein